MRHSVRLIGTGALGLALVASGAGLAGAASARVTPHVNGLTPTSVTVGAIVTQSGPLAADFKPYLSGAEAYFAYVNSLPGKVNGRSVLLPSGNELDDQSSGSQNIAAARTLVTNKKVFAIVGVSVPFFDAHTYLATTGIPTFGYATDNVWKKAKNLFADYGSVLNFASSVPHFAYVAKQTHSKKVAVVSLSYAASKNECKGAASGLQTYGSTYGFKLAYTNLNESIAQNWSIEANKMRVAGVDMVISCMDVNSNVGLAKQTSLAGMHPVQLWLDGYNRKTLQNNTTYMQKTYFLLQHVPFEASAAYPTAFPGLNLYMTWMANSGHAADAYSDVALMGWMSANTFVMGLRAAGKSPTPASVVTALNKITKDVGSPKGGVITPVNWTIAHTGNTSPACETFVKTNGSSFQMVFNKTSHPWICFKLGVKANLNAPVPAPTGTPGK